MGSRFCSPSQGLQAKKLGERGYSQETGPEKRLQGPFLQGRGPVQTEPGGGEELGFPTSAVSLLLSLSVTHTHHGEL